MEFSDVIRTRRSVRSYSEAPLDDALIDRILEAARVAPSAVNNQPWHFIVVRDADRRRKLAEFAAGQMFIAEAPVVIAACGLPYHDRYSWIADNMFLVDVAIALTHLTLAARAEGLGTCWIGAFSHDSVHRLLRVPKTHRVVMLTPLGYPADAHAFHDEFKRKKMTEIISYETFGGAK